MFGHIMAEPERCRVFLQQILGFHIDRVELIEKQFPLDEKADAHGIRLDIYVDDGQTVYNCEMQTSKPLTLPKRIRYYQSMIDINLLKKGENYENLKKSFVIFICTFDPFDRGRYVYTFENLCLEDNELHLNDEALKIFVNTKGTIGNVSDEFRELMHFLDTSEIKEYQNPLVNELAEELKKARTRDEWRNEWMSIEMLKHDARAEGKIEGKIEGKMETLIGLVKDGLISIQEASARAQMNEQEFAECVSRA